MTGEASTYSAHRSRGHGALPHDRACYEFTGCAPLPTLRFRAFVQDIYKHVRIIWPGSPRSGFETLNDLITLSSVGLSGPRAPPASLPAQISPRVCLLES